MTARISRAYDKLGRMTSYVDADGNTSTTTYDRLSRPATVSNGQSVRTYTYDGGYERRGLLTGVNDSLTGTFTAEYDADGKIYRETWPNGIQQTSGYNEIGARSGLVYQRPNCGQDDCTIYSALAGYSAQGQNRWVTSSLAEEVYGYDQAGRLNLVTDTVAGSCTTRYYEFDNASNRTRKAVFGPGTGGNCQTDDPATQTAHTYDDAGRILGGYTYDTLGRTTTLPADDSGNPGGGDPVTISYYSTDFVSRITQGSHTTTYTLDVEGVRIRAWADNATGVNIERRHHYADDSDNPTWTDEGAGKWTVPIASIGGDIAATQTDTGTQWAISDLRGNRVATISDDEPGVSSTGRSDEYGNPLGDTASDNNRYRWLAGQQRAADTPSGLVIMGVRLYNPVTGRFLTVDPEQGGNAGPYTYPSDPINHIDPSGEYAIPFPILAIIGIAAIAALIWWYSTCGWSGCTVRVGKIRIASPYKYAWSAARYATTLYYVYRIYAESGNRTWKYGITRQTPHYKRPRSQLGACNRFFSTGTCTFEGYWVRGWYNARSLEAFLITQYTLRHRHCPPGQWSSCR